LQLNGGEGVNVKEEIPSLTKQKPGRPRDNAIVVVKEEIMKMHHQRIGKYNKLYPMLCIFFCKKNKNISNSYWDF
jgi:hypothetical protein